MAGMEMLQFGYGTNFMRLNVGGPTLIYMVVGMLLHLGLLTPVQCQLNVDGIVSDTVGTIGGLDDAVKLCEYTCPEGYKRVKNESYVSRSNGCGSYGFQFTVDKYPSITNCCNTHDTCYDICGIDKVQCDEELEKCVKNCCGGVTTASVEPSAFEFITACQVLSELFYGVTTALGCPAFLNSQKQACLCQPE